MNEEGFMTPEVDSLCSCFSLFRTTALMELFFRGSKPPLVAAATRGGLGFGSSKLLELLLVVWD
jgi:hypothetical protein